MPDTDNDPVPVPVSEAVATRCYDKSPGLLGRFFSARLLWQDDNPISFPIPGSFHRTLPTTEAVPCHHITLTAFRTAFVVGTADAHSATLYDLDIDLDLFVFFHSCSSSAYEEEPSIYCLCSKHSALPSFVSLILSSFPCDSKQQCVTTCDSV